MEAGLICWIRGRVRRNSSMLSLIIQYHTLPSGQYLKAYKRCISISWPDHGCIWMDPLFHFGGLWRPCITSLSTVSAHLHLFVGVHNHVACYKTRQRDCIIGPLLKLCNHLLSDTFDALMKSELACCEHVWTTMHLLCRYFHISMLTCFGGWINIQ